MNKKVIITAVALGAAVVYAARKLAGRKRISGPNPQPRNHHLTPVFARAKQRLS